MKERALVYLSLVISIVALGEAVWVREHAEKIAEQALQRRELQFVQTFAPKVRDTCAGMEMTNMVANPTNLEQLFGPMLESINQMSASATNDEKKSP